MCEIYYTLSKKFIDRHIGKENLFNNNYNSLGLTSRNCPYYEGSACKPNSWGRYKDEYHYPKINGLYLVYPVDSQFPEMMFLGRVLDERYFLDDVKNAIQQQIGLSADNDATLVSINGKSSYDYIEYYKFQLYGKYIELSVYIRGVRDSIGGPSVTTIDYRFEDVTRSVDKCIKRKKSDQRIKEKGKTIRLD